MYSKFPTVSICKFDWVALRMEKMSLSKTSHLEYFFLQLEYFIYICYISYIYWLLLLLFLYIYMCETIYIYILIWNICSKVNTIYININIIYIYIHRYLVANNAGTFILIVGSQQCWRANNIIYKGWLFATGLLKNIPTAMFCNNSNIEIKQPKTTKFL